MPPRGSTLVCSRCGSRQGCLVCAPTSLTPREALAEILSIVARVHGTDNAADAVLMETERMCRSLLGARG